MQRYGTGGFFGKDREGSPVFWDRLGQIDVHGLVHHFEAHNDIVPDEEIVEYEVAKMELMNDLLLEASACDPDGRVHS